VPIAHQLDFQDAADRARGLLKGWNVEDINAAAIIVLQLHNEGVRLFRDDIRKSGGESYGRPTRTIYRAKKERTDPITLDGRPLPDSALFAVFSLTAIASACKETKALERITDKTPDLLADDMRRAGTMYVDQMAVLAQATIERAELLHQSEGRERSEVIERRKKAQKGGLSRKPVVRQYQWKFIQDWESGRYKGRSRPYAARDFLRRNPAPTAVSSLQNPERTLVDALKRHEKGKFTPPE